MPPASGEIYEVTYQQLLHGSTRENVLHYRALTPLITDAAIIAAVERFWFFSQVVQSINVTYSQMIVKRMTPIPLDEHIAFPTTVTVGQRSTQSMNNTVAGVYTIRTGTAGKSHRGRFYLPGVPLDFSDDGGNTYNATGSALVTAFANNLLSEFGPSGTNTAVALGVYSRVIGGTHPFTVAGWQEMTRVDAQAILGNQRRRRLGRGI